MRMQLVLVVYMCVHPCVYVYIFTYICICIHTCVYVYICAHICTRIYENDHLIEFAALPNCRVVGDSARPWTRQIRQKETSISSKRDIKRHIHIFKLSPEFLQ